MRLIYAEELKAKLENFVYLTEVAQHSDLVEGENIAFKKALELLDDAPTIEAEPIRHGHWEYDEISGNNQCSVCFSSDERISGYCNSSDFEYCPWCGAKMG